MMVCLDTNIIIDFLKEKEYAIGKINELQEEGIELSTTTINTFELFKGVERLGNPEAISPLNQVLSDIFIYDFDFEASRKAAEIFEDLRTKGELLDLADIMIAAVVISNNETLLTGNIKHFERIQGLRVEEARK